jgi:alpha-ketoglutarate-dependent taurine dioxygenase
MTTTLDVRPVDASFGAVVTGVKLTELDDPTWRNLYATWLKYAPLIFPGQHLKREEQIAFAKRFGPSEFELSVISNVRPDGTLREDRPDDDVVNVLKGNEGWHADSTFKKVQAKGAVFSAQIVPTIGGHTGWADMRAAYDALDPVLKAKVEKLSAYHSYNHSQAKVGNLPKEGSEAMKYGYTQDAVPLRPLVKVHPETGRKSLLIGRHAYNIPGMSEAESDAFLEGLIEFACQAPRVYHHDWRAGDLVIWDNRCLLHRATPWDMTQPRIMWHSRIAGDPATESASSP